MDATSNEFDEEDERPASATPQRRSVGKGSRRKRATIAAQKKRSNATQSGIHKRKEKRLSW